MNLNPPKTNNQLWVNPTNPPAHDFMKLVLESTGEEIYVFQRVRNFRDELCTVVAMEPPTCEGKSGYVHLVYEENTPPHRVYPEVIKAKFLKSLLTPQTNTK